MRFLLAIIFCALFQLIGSTQEWAPIGAVWKYSQIESEPPWNYRSHQIISKKDTTIESQDCRKLEWLVIAHGVIDNTRNLYTFMEDEKVYFYNENDQEFELKYDFSASEGDTIRMGVDTSFGWSDVTYVESIVDSIRAEMSNGNTLKVQYLRDISRERYFVSGKVYNGIGRLFWLMESTGGVDPPVGGGLICYSDGMTELGDFESCDDLVNLIDNEDLNYLRIYPNPAFGELRIEGLKGKEKIELYNPQGIKIDCQEKDEIRFHQNGLHVVIVKAKDKIRIHKIMNVGF